MTLDQATCEALKAGHNTVLFSHKLHATRTVLDQVLAVVQSDARLRVCISKDYARILAFKKNHRGRERVSAAIFANGF
jgi:hypothetical protein